MAGWKSQSPTAVEKANITDENSSYWLPLLTGVRARSCKTNALYLKCPPSLRSPGCLGFCWGFHFKEEETSTIFVSSYHVIETRWSAHATPSLCRDWTRVVVLRTNRRSVNIMMHLKYLQSTHKPYVNAMFLMPCATFFKITNIFLYILDMKDIHHLLWQTWYINVFMMCLVKIGLGKYS